MSEVRSPVVPVWTITTDEAPISSVPLPLDALTPTRLAELRSALAGMNESPIVTLEAHPMPNGLDRRHGIPLDAMSPLAQELSKLLTKSAKSVPAVAEAAAGGEILYRMVVPAKVAAAVGQGLIKPMTSNAASGAIHGGLVQGGRLAAQASFLPVETAAAGAAAGATGTAAAGAALTVAAPLVLMAIAVGVSAYADYQRQKAIENITELLEKLHSNQLEHERTQLDGCKDAIDKATALLLDQGKVGASLGLDSAVHAISSATATAERRLQGWQAALDAYDGKVAADELTRAFPGIDGKGGEFRTHLQIAALAIALKRRVILLQGVEAGQSVPDNRFENFVRSLKADQQRIDELESGLRSVLRRLGELQLRTPRHGLVANLMTRKSVDDLLKASHRLRALGAGDNDGSVGDLAIEIARHADGTLLVLPASAA